MSSSTTKFLTSLLAACLAVVSMSCPVALGQGDTDTTAARNVIRIDAVRLGWPAQQAELEMGDVIKAIDNVEVTSEDAFLETVAQATRKGSVLSLTVVDVRTGREINRKVRPSRIDGKLGIMYTFVESPFAGKARRIFRRHGFNPEGMPKGRFYSGKQDPILVHIAWSNVRKDFEKLLMDELQLESPPSLYLYLVKEGEQLRFCFADQPEPVKRALRTVLPLDEKSFLSIVPVTRQIAVEVKSFLPQYRAGDGLNLVRIERELINFDRPGILKGLNATGYRKAYEYVYARTAWKESQSGKTRDGRYFFRIVQGVRKYKPDTDLWSIFVWFDIRYLPNSEFDPERYGIRATTSNDAPDLAQRLTVYAAKKAGTNATKIRHNALRYSGLWVGAEERRTFGA